MTRVNKENGKENNSPSIASTPRKILLVVVLLAALIALYFANNSSDTETVAPQGVQDTKPVPENISKGIDSIVRVFGISDKWIRERKTSPKSGKDEQLWFSKEVKLPLDLPALNVNLDLTNFLHSKGLSARTTEEPRTKNLAIDILHESASGTSKVAQMILQYSDSVRRITSDVCIILDSIEYLSIKEAEEILNSAENFSVIMPLRNDKVDFQSLVLERKRDFVIEMTLGSAESYESDFREGMSEKEMRSKVRTVSFNFPATSGIVLRSTKQFPEQAQAISAEFAKYNIKTYADTGFAGMFFSEDKLSWLISEINNNGNSGKLRFAVISSLNSKELVAFSEALIPLRKRGYRFSNFKQYIKRQIKSGPRDSTDSNNNTEGIAPEN